MRFLLACAIALSLAACHRSGHQALPGNEAASMPVEAIKGVHRNNKGKPAPAGEFEDSDGKRIKLADLKGKAFLLNLWATWCAPCVKELPTLDRLARERRLPVVAVSEDMAPRASVLAFMKAHRISTLKAYQDPKMELSAALGPDTVLPTSILIDADGREVWRYVGDLDWTSPEASRLLAEHGAGPKGS
jgi:thiol-disulfide isomerase/thioredoxin